MVEELHPGGGAALSCTLVEELRHGGGAELRPAELS